MALWAKLESGFLPKDALVQGAADLFPQQGGIALF
jgi:hypothetical protein